MNNIKKGRGGWLIPLAFLCIIAWPLPAILGLLWSRWLRPFSLSGQIGYALCWLSITLVPFSAAYFSLTFEPFLFDRVWQLALYAILFLIWFLAINFFIDNPSLSIKRASLIAIAGALLIGPSILFGGQVPMFLPFAASLALTVAGWAVTGVTPDLSAAVLIFALPILVFIAHLVVQWPKQSTGSHDEA